MYLQYNHNKDEGLKWGKLYLILKLEVKLFSQTNKIHFNENRQKLPLAIKPKQQ